MAIQSPSSSSPRERAEADWAQVTRVDSKKWFEAEVRDGHRYFGNIVDSGVDGVLAVEGEDAAVRLPFSELVLINQSNESPGSISDLSITASLGWSP